MTGLMDRVARLEERMDDKDARIAALETELAAARERMEAAEVALRMIRIDAAWAIDAERQVLAHFARYKEG